MVNLRSNYPNLREEGEIFKKFVAGYATEDFRIRSASPFLTTHEQETFSVFLEIDHSVLLQNSEIISCNSGTAAIFALLSRLLKSYNRIAVEDFTYSGLLNAARRLQFDVAPLLCDEEGPLPEGIKKALDHGIKLFYLQPTIHNPTNRVMGEERRRRIAGILKETDALLIEDDAYRFLHPSPPPRFLQLLPAQTISLTSLSKPYHSFLQTCFLAYPKDRLSGLDDIIDLSGTGTPYLMRCFSSYLLKKGYLSDLIAKKKVVALERKKRVEEILSGVSYKTFPTSFHLWVRLPPFADAIALTKALKQQNILIAGGHEYSPTADTSHIRIALSAEEDATKRNGAIQQIKDLLLN